MTRLRRLAVLALLPLAWNVAGCDSGTFKSSVDQGSNGRLDGKAPPRESGPSPFDFSNPDPPRLDANCGGQTIPITLTQKGDIPDLHLVVDRSGSMMLPVDIFQWQLGTKWQVMVKTLSSLVDAYPNNIRFGLTLFPQDNACAAGQIDVALTLGANTQIKQVLAQTGPNGSTPTHTSLAAVGSYLPTVPAVPGGRHVLLATDGAPNCGATADTDTSSETLAEVQKLAAAGYKVFVVGFGDIIAGNPGLLNQLATAGGVPNPSGPFKFYAAANETELKNAFFNIAGGLIPPPCTYKLAAPPADPDLVTVTFDGKPVPRSLSSTAGWNYTAGGTEITFFGQFCDLLRTGSVKEVKFAFGCKGPVIK